MPCHEEAAKRTAVYLHRVRQVFRSQLNCWNKIRAVDTYALAIIRTFAMITWPKEEMEATDGLYHSPASGDGLSLKDTQDHPRRSSGDLYIYKEFHDLLFDLAIYEVAILQFWIKYTAGRAVTFYQFIDQYTLIILSEANRNSLCFIGFDAYDLMYFC